MKNETARREIESLDYYLQNHTDDYSEESHTAMMMGIKALEQEPKIDSWSIKDVADTFKKHGLIREQEPCKDAISRQAVLDILKREGRKWGNDYRDWVDAIEEIKNLSSVNPTKTGHWIEIAQYSDGNHKIECSECESHIFDRGHANSFNVKNKYKYCPNCGARMVEPQESEV